MKMIQRTSYVLKVIGIVLILLSLVLGMYALINTGASREMLSQGLTRYGADQGILDTFAFDRHFFSALSRSADNRNLKEEARLTAIDGDWRSAFDKAENAVRSQEKEIRSNTAAWLKGQTPASLGLDAMEELQESRELREIFEYVDGLAAPPKKGKLASMKAASQEPFFREYYAAFAEEQGENAGTWYEFMSAVRSMIAKSADEGTPVKDVKAWMNESFTPEAYAPVLEEVRAAEKTESAESLSGLLSAEFDRGDEADYMAFLDRIAETLPTWIWEGRVPPPCWRQSCRTC